jgi:hypothetical protein
VKVKREDVKGMHLLRLHVFTFHEFSRNIMAKTAAVLVLALLAAGCAQERAPVVAAAAPDPTPAAQPAPFPQRPRPAVIDLSLLQITVPTGSISGSAKFWSHVETPVVDPAVDDLLRANGLRVGRGAVKDWPRLKEVFDAVGANTVQSHFLAPAATDQDIVVSDLIPEETLFCFGRHGLAGQVYDQCQNMLSLSFAPAPGRPDDVRLELSPVVHSVRRHYSYSVLNQQDSVDFASDEHVYDLDLRVDLPPGKFLIVSPSPESERPTSIGHQFLTRDFKSARRDVVLLFVVNGYATADSPGAPKVPASAGNTSAANGPASAAGGR